MSLDDQTPTQYFGADAQVWDSPDGRSLQLTPAGGRLAAKFGWVRNGAKTPLVLDAAGDRPHNDDRTPAGDTGHRNGCAFGRTARCTCINLMQWDRTPEYTAPTFAADGPLHHHQPAPFPLEEKDYYPTINKPLEALTVNGEIWEPRSLRLGNEAHIDWLRAELLRQENRPALDRGYKNFTALFFGLAVTGWALAIARGVWNF